MMDMTPRYAPTEVMTIRGVRPVTKALFHPPGTHRGAIRPDMGALELVTDQGSRWYGFEGGAINSQLRMTVWGFSPRFEEVAAWKPVPEKFRVPGSGTATTVHEVSHGRQLGERHYPNPAPTPHHFVSRRVADFSTLPDLIKHAKSDLGATHVSGSGSDTRIYFPRGDGQYEEATVWQKGNYWHATGPGARMVVRKLPREAKPITQAGMRWASEAPRGRGSFRIGQPVQTTMGVRRSGRVIAPVSRDQWTDGTYRPPGPREQAVWVQWSDGTKGWSHAQHLSPSTETVVRDYEATDRQGRTTAGPFKSYDDARQAAGGSGTVKYVSPTKQATERRSAHRRR
jgi:hypothetical protein